MNIGIVEELYEREHNVIRAVRLRSRKTYNERPIQFLYPLELSCDTWKKQKMVHQCLKKPINTNANESKPRRNPAARAEVRIRDAAETNKNVLCSSFFTHFVK